MKGGDLGVGERTCATISFSSGILIHGVSSVCLPVQITFCCYDHLRWVSKTAYSVMTFLVVTAPNYHSNFV
jgi:hypothetical protein